jgi:hypothetical protein
MWLTHITKRGLSIKITREYYGPPGWMIVDVIAGSQLLGPTGRASRLALIIALRFKLKMLIFRGSASIFAQLGSPYARLLIIRHFCRLREAGIARGLMKQLRIRAYIQRNIFYLSSIFSYAGMPAREKSIGRDTEMILLQRVFFSVSGIIYCYDRCFLGIWDKIFLFLNYCQPSDTFFLILKAYFFH